MRLKPSKILVNEDIFHDIKIAPTSQIISRNNQTLLFIMRNVMVRSLHFVVVIIDYRDLSHNQLKDLSPGVFGGIYWSFFSTLTL